MLNIIVRKSRNKHHELSGQEWRASNSDWWHELEENEKKINKNFMESGMSKAYFKDLEGIEKDNAEVDLQILINALIGKKEEAKKIDNSSMIKLSGIFDSIETKVNPKNANSKPSLFETRSKEKISKTKK